MKELGEINLSEDFDNISPLNALMMDDMGHMFEEALSARIIAQPEAVGAISDLYQVYLGDLNVPDKPIGTTLFVGPTGAGKTRVVEAAAEILFGDRNAVVKVDCAEFQHSHEIAKLIGSPPGYLGHRETSPILTQEHLNRYRGEKGKSGVNLTLVLFDEIEKASDALWQLLLGILDKATLTLGDNRRVDFSHCIVVMTSNLGAREMADLTNGSIGFQNPKRSQPDKKKLRTIGEGAVTRKFSPEFVNRIDKLVTFGFLDEGALAQILELELGVVQHRITASDCPSFVLTCTDEAKKFLLTKGYDKRYNARALKRVIEHYLILPLSKIVSSKQIGLGDNVIAYFDEQSQTIQFGKKSISALVQNAREPALTAGRG